MHRHWRLRRQTHPCSDGQRRWNQAYQLLLEWTMLDEPLHAVPTVPLPLSAPANQEEDDAHRPVSTGLDPATSPPADQ
jgi:hypothetical protein